MITIIYLIAIIISILIAFILFNNSYIFCYLEFCFLKNFKKIDNKEQIMIDIFFFLSCFCIGYISARYFLLF